MRTRRWDHGDGVNVVKVLTEFSPRGILAAWGSGFPEGVDRGINGRLFKNSTLDLSSCVVLAAPSYGGLFQRDTLASHHEPYLGWWLHL